MRTAPFPPLSGMALASAMALTAGLAAPLQATAGPSAQALEQGRKIAFTRKLGNCLACHHIAGGTAAGNIGPPLVAMKQRYPNKAKLHAQIWDATVANPETPMPPFGRHQILTERQIDLLTDYIWSL